MIAEIGQFALALALVTALIQAIIPQVGAARGIAAWMLIAQPAAILQFGLMGVAFAALTQAYLTSDFTVLNVVQNSHSLKPIIYKISGVWGNHEGSLVLWVLILALFGAMVAIFGNNIPPTLKARVLSIQAMIAVGFLTFMLYSSNPFLRVFPPPPNGNGLNPLLQDPGLAVHPPVLYTGYVGFSIAFSFAVAALIEGKVDAAWARWVRPWTLLAWSFLTAGIGLGSWWAYYELGWGGWWYWDPVENASFMPWLVGTALLHSALVVERRDALKTWTILLAIITFSLSLVGTFLVRSGVLTSVHAFATDPARGIFILLLLVVVIGGSLTLYAVRAPKLKGGGLFSPISREGSLVLNNLFLTTAAATVFLGTLYPLFLEAIGGDKVSVGPPFFNTTFVPLMIPLIVALGIGPMLAWKRGDLAGVFGRLKFAFVLTLIAAAVTCYLTWGRSFFGVIGIALSTWLATAVLIAFSERTGLGRVPFSDAIRRIVDLPRNAWGMTLTHFGFAILVAGITGASHWQDESVLTMVPREKAEIAGYTITLERIQEHPGPNYRAQRGTFSVRKNDKFVTILEPERRFYMVHDSQTTEAAIFSTAFADLYVVIGDGDNVNGVTVRLYHKPFVPWIWLGLAVMVGGGLTSLTDRRLRVGAPTRKGKRVALQAPESLVD